MQTLQIEAMAIEDFAFLKHTRRRNKAITLA